MLAIQGIYDGVEIKPKEVIPFSEGCEVIITFLRPESKCAFSEKNDIEERLAIINSLVGILPSTVTDEEIIEERMKRYERDY
jgi:predicted DNA-binding antitoxin AbrB/MazE fold protein